MSEGQFHSPEERAQARANAPAVRDSTRASSLDIADKEMRELVEQATRLATEYFAHVTELPVFRDTSAGELSRTLGRTLPVEGMPLARLLDDCRAIIDGNRQNGHPRMFGYVASPSTPVGAFAELLAATLNQNVTVWRSAPAATTIERMVVGWLAQLIGYGEECGGLLTSGGSMANLNAIFVAHRTKAGGAEGGVSRRGLWGERAPAVMYVSDQSHLSLAKAADVLGLGREQVRVVPTGDDFRMNVRDLRESIAGDVSRGLRPFCVTANAGTVATGAIDPLAEIARTAREHDLWFHIDGAYGALGALDKSKRPLFEGLDLADSVSLDPHKWLYTPLGCGCLLYRRPEQARAAFSGTEDHYITVFEEEPEEAFAFWDYGVELSRPFRALKVWMLLSYYGARRVAAAITEDNALGAYFGAQVGAADDFELLAPITLGICCFRYVPAKTSRALEAAGAAEREELEARLNELNARIMQKVQRGGGAYVSNAVLRGRFALRASITNFRTTRKDIDYTLDVVRSAARECEITGGDN